MSYLNLRIFARGAVIFALSTSAITFGPTVAVAQDDDALQMARSNFQRAIELKQAGNYSGALKLFREVGTVKMSPQVRYHIASCEEKLGQLVAALGGYELAMSTGSDMPEDFITEVQSAIDSLNARIPKLVIERGDGAEAAAIKLDGVALGQSSIGVEIPLNPGPHTVEAEAPGYENFQETLTIVEEEAQSLNIAMSPIPEPEPEPMVEPAAPPPPQPQFGVAPYVVGGAGLALAVTGGVLLGVSQGKVAAIKKTCDGTDCTQLSQDEQDKAQRKFKSAQRLEVAGWVSLGVGLAATGAGIVMYYLDSKRVTETAVLGARVRFVPVATDKDWGLAVLGSF